MATQIRPLSEIKKVDVAELVAKLKADNDRESKDAGLALLKSATEFGVSIREYLQLAVKQEDRVGDLDGYQTVLAKMDLPVKNDFANGVYMQAASETFQMYPGARALFPEVIDDVIRFATRQDNLLTVKPLLANSRTINGVELLSTVIEDEQRDRDTFVIAELSNIPVRSLKTSEKSVKFYKHGSAIRTSYEFNRRVSIDILIPHAKRIARELELSKLNVATAVLINGDGAYSAAPSVTQSSLDASTGSTSTTGQINWVNFLKWLMNRAQAGVPVDTIAMNWDAYFQWVMMFAKQIESTGGENFGSRAVENLSLAGVTMQRAPASIAMLFNITPVLAPAVPAGQLLGFSREDTLEELIEAGSNISETERVITNQSVTMTRTENTGYKLVYGDTRQIYNFGA